MLTGRHPPSPRAWPANLRRNRQLCRLRLGSCTNLASSGEMFSPLNVYKAKVFSAKCFRRGMFISRRYFRAVGRVSVEI